MKKVTTTIISLIIILICTMSLTMVIGCEKEIEPRKVVLELVNPITGEAVQDDETIDLPEEGTPIEVRIKDRETGRYLTDEDLPENTIQGSCHVNLAIIDYDGFSFTQEYYKNWPTKEDLAVWDHYNYYKMIMFFDYRPENPKDPKKFQRRYEKKTSYVRFYINKPWKK